MSGLIQMRNRITELEKELEASEATIVNALSNADRLGQTILLVRERNPEAIGVIEQALKDAWWLDEKESRIERIEELEQKNHVLAIELTASNAKLDKTNSIAIGIAIEHNDKANKLKEITNALKFIVHGKCPCKECPALGFCERQPDFAETSSCEFVIINKVLLGIKVE